MNLTDILQRLDHLESQIAFQEHTINELNQLVSDQNQELALFKRHLQLVAGKVSELDSNHDESISSGDERPPHY